jgi:NADP-dependent 3-hydroxy acid dehydrogenase YdfG
MLARGEDGLRTAASSIGDRATYRVCDLGNPSAIATAAGEIRRDEGVPDIVVNNAGTFPLASISATSVDDFAATLAVNLTGPFALVRAFIGDMAGRGSGHIVTIGSIADRNIFAENGAYAASKFGLRALHEVMRCELRGSGVRTTLVAPGPVDTHIWDEIDPDHRPGFTPRRDMLGADDVARAIVFAVTQPEGVNVDELRLSRS